MVKKRGLGKSLNALLSYTHAHMAEGAEHGITHDSDPHASQQLDPASHHTLAPRDQLATLPIAKIQAGKYQPRQQMDSEALAALAQSIRSQGILQPLLVRALNPSSPNTYEIIAGERRFRAAQLAGLKEVPVIVRAVPDEAAVAIALIENIQRENLNPIEEAVALQRLIEEFGLTHEQTAEAVGKSRAGVSNLLRLLSLPQAIKTLLAQGQLEMGHARCLITLPPALQQQAAEQIVARQLSVRDTEQLVRNMQHPAKVKTAKPQDPDIAHLEKTLSARIKLPVKLQCNARGKGRLVIHYKNLSQLDQLLNQFEAYVSD